MLETGTPDQHLSYLTQDTQCAGGSNLHAIIQIEISLWGLISSAMVLLFLASFGTFQPIRENWHAVHVLKSLHNNQSIAKFFAAFRKLNLGCLLCTSIIPFLCLCRLYHHSRVCIHLFCTRCFVDYIFDGFVCKGEGKKEAIPAILMWFQK